MVDALALIGYLQAALAHSEVHGVHVDASWVWFFVSWLCNVGIHIFVNWHSDIDFLASSLPNGLHESGESWMRVYCLINNKLGSGGWVNRGEISLVLLHLAGKLLVRKYDMVFGSKRWCICK